MPTRTFTLHCRTTSPKREAWAACRNWDRGAYFLWDSTAAPTLLRNTRKRTSSDLGATPPGQNLPGRLGSCSRPHTTLCSYLWVGKSFRGGTKKTLPEEGLTGTVVTHSLSGSFGAGRQKGASVPHPNAKKAFSSTGPVMSLEERRTTARQTQRGQKARREWSEAQRGWSLMRPDRPSAVRGQRVRANKCAVTHLV